MSWCNSRKVERPYWVFDERTEREYDAYMRGFIASVGGKEV
jgi:hypothetical protein